MKSAAASLSEQSSARHSLFVDRSVPEQIDGVDSVLGFLFFPDGSMGGHAVMTSGEICQLLMRLDERVEAMARDCEQLKHVLLEGNGSPALTVQVATMNQRLLSLEESDGTGRPALSIQVATMDQRLLSLEDRDRSKSMPRAAWVAIVVSSIIGIAGLAVAIVKGLL